MPYQIVWAKDFNEKPEGQKEGLHLNFTLLCRRRKLLVKSKWAKITLILGKGENSVISNCQHDTHLSLPT